MMNSMKIVAHDVRKVISVVHGYISLIQLDIAEDAVDSEKLVFLRFGNVEHAHESLYVS